MFYSQQIETIFIVFLYNKLAFGHTTPMIFRKNQIVGVHGAHPFRV